MSVEQVCSTPEACLGVDHVSRDSALLQTRRDVTKLTVAATENSSAWSSRRRKVTSDCARRLNMFDKRSAACVVVRDNRALLVWVHYGRAPGWDLPGGQANRGE